MWETWVWSLGWEDPLENGKATHYSKVTEYKHEKFLKAFKKLSILLSSSIFRRPLSSLSLNRFSETIVPRMKWNSGESGNFELNTYQLTLKQRNIQLPSFFYCWINVTKYTLPLFPWVSFHLVLYFHSISLPIDDLQSPWSTGMVKVMDVYTWYLATKPHDPAVPFLGIYLEKNMVWKDTCTSVFIAALCSTVYNSQDKEAI